MIQQYIFIEILFTKGFHNLKPWNLLAPNWIIKLNFIYGFCYNEISKII